MTDSPTAYDRWISRRVPIETAESVSRQRSMRPWASRPVFELILVLQPGHQAWLADTIDSLAQQRYDGWQLTIVAGEPSPLPEFEQDEGPIRWLVAPAKTPLGELVDRRLSRSTADWIGFFESGTRFSPDFLLLAGDYIAARPHWRLIYADEDGISPDGQRSGPLFKPDINLDLLRTTDYIGDILVAREALLACGGYGDRAGAERYDMALRLIERHGKEALGHIPEVLYHVPSPVFRRARGEAARDTLAAHLQRRGVAADILPGLVPGQTRRVSYKHGTTQLVSIIVPNKNHLRLLRACVDSLRTRTSYPAWELLIVDNGSDDPGLLAYYRELQSAEPERARILAIPGEFNFSAMNNAAAKAARGEYLLLLNNDTEVLHADWLDVMMSHAQRPEIGIVGARLLFPGNRRIQHAGIVLGMEGGAGHVFVDAQGAEQPGYLYRALAEQNYSAVTGACLLVRASLYREVGGLNEEDFKVCYNDVDLCLKIGQLGYETLWTPHATLLHHGSATQRGEYVDPEKGKAAAARLQKEAYELARRWRGQLVHDPCWNRNLSLAATSPTIEDELAVTWNPDFHDAPRILGMPVVTQGQAEYRSFGPLRALHAAGLAQCATACQPAPGYDRAPTPIELARMAPDTLLIHTPVDDVRLIGLLHYKQLNPEVLRVYSIDDLITDIPADNPSHKGLPREAVGERLRLGLAASDRAVVSTEPLAEMCRGMIDDIRIVPNMLEARTWGKVASRRRGNARLRVGWAGAQQHAGDLRFLLDVVKATAAEVDWVFFGMMPAGAAPHVAEFHDFVHRFADYPARLAALDLDLAVAPLAVNPFNEAKSNLRLLEYGILGWPVICTDILPYRTGNPPVTRLPNDSRAWIAAIRERAADRAALAAEGDALQSWVRSGFLLENHLELWLSALTR